MRLNRVLPALFLMQPDPASGELKYLFVPTSDFEVLRRGDEDFGEEWKSFDLCLFLTRNPDDSFNDFRTGSAGLEIYNF